MINVNLTEQKQSSKYFIENVETKPNHGTYKPHDIPFLIMTWSSISNSNRSIKIVQQNHFSERILTNGSEYRLSIGQNSKQYSQGFTLLKENVCRRKTT